MGLGLRALIAILVLAVPAHACTAPPYPAEEIWLVAAEDGERVLETDTGRTHRYDPCRSNLLGSPFFDGRFVHWTAGGQGMVFDMDTRVVFEVDGRPAVGHVVRVASSSFEVEDLATRATWTVQAPGGHAFHVDGSGVVAKAGNETTGDLRRGLAVYDVREQGWVFDAPLEGQGGLAFAHASPDWVAFFADQGERDLWVLELATAEVHGPLSLQPPAGTSGGQATSSSTRVLDIVGDRLYFHAVTNYPGQQYSDARWSVLLPAGNEEQHGGPPAPDHGGRAAYYETRSQTSTTTPTPTPDPDAPTTVTEGAVTAGDGNASESGRASPTAATGDSPGPALALLGLVLALLAVRRRLRP